MADKKDKKESTLEEFRAFLRQGYHGKWTWEQSVRVVFGPRYDQAVVNQTGRILRRMVRGPSEWALLAARFDVDSEFLHDTAKFLVSRLTRDIPKKEAVKPKKASAPKTAAKAPDREAVPSTS